MYMYSASYGAVTKFIECRINDSMKMEEKKKNVSRLNTIGEGMNPFLFLFEFVRGIC